MKWTIHKLEVKAAASGLRLDQFIAAEEVGISRTLAKKLIDLGGVHVNGRRSRSCSLLVTTKDRIEVYIDHLPTDPYRISEAEIVFRDPYLIILNKPAMVDTQPTHARYKGTLYEALQWLLKDKFRPQNKVELGMVQRLDRGTTGLIVFSIHPRAHKKMTQIFLEHQVEKRYLALVGGAPEPPAGEIRSLLARTRQENKVRSVTKGGKEALTKYRLIENFSSAALLDVQILTGRSHQIRAHLSEQGCPLLGDQRYGGATTSDGMQFKRPLLHAAELNFAHPVTGDRLEFTAPLPADMAGAIEYFKNR